MNDKVLAHLYTRNTNLCMFLLHALVSFHFIESWIIFSLSYLSHISHYMLFPLTFNGSFFLSLLQQYACTTTGLSANVSTRWVVSSWNCLLWFETEQNLDQCVAFCFFWGFLFSSADAASTFSLVAGALSKVTVCPSLWIPVLWLVRALSCRNSFLTLCLKESLHPKYSYTVITEIKDFNMNSRWGPDSFPYQTVGSITHYLGLPVFIRDELMLSTGDVRRRFSSWFGRSSRRGALATQLSSLWKIHGHSSVGSPTRQTIHRIIWWVHNWRLNTHTRVCTSISSVPSWSFWAIGAASCLMAGQNLGMFHSSVWSE